MPLTAAYGGAKWSPRPATLRDDMAQTWGDWGVASEVGTLRAVLLRRPGPELDGIADFDAAQMRAGVLPEVARAQHDGLADAYCAHGVDVYYVEHGPPDKPNLMFVRDLMLMTPEGAIVTRPASTVRAGEERFVAEALAGAGVPILMTVHGGGTFEGADVAWVDRDLCFLAEGLRTNTEGADQVERMLREIGVAEVIRVGLPYGAMHLDGLLSLVDRDLAVVWPRRTPYAVVAKLRQRGFRLIEVPDEEEAQHRLPMNGVALAPGVLLMPTGGDTLRAAYDAAGVETHEVDVSELIKAGGGIHCMTGFLKRDDP
ncbi:MAG: NG,NG-dimethylarginine dimethylaminohydrolase 1 [uncultured Thermomicrobiales bacterium]|uniref:arginine deiminase n=1 Tax=uncultured Thermomicrobiales bacterium TaxID=1645740 RepID=A0A6J4U831_9BACT|nr:MAG: NG,NG-dimethylarginine dimethylaminohydrolase 1 [uncultured Thermomicrobiales bacterium]